MIRKLGIAFGCLVALLVIGGLAVRALYRANPHTFLNTAVPRTSNAAVMSF